MQTTSAFSRLTADEAAEMVFDGATVGFSGFAGAGFPKGTPQAIAAQLRGIRQRNESLLVRIISAAGLGCLPDEGSDEDAACNAAPGEYSVSLHRWNGRLPTIDMQSSQLPRMVEHGLLGNVDLAVVEAVDVVRDGRVYLSTSTGPSPSLLRRTAKVIVEVNHRQASRLAEMHDVPTPAQAPHRLHIPLEEVLTRIGAPYVAIDPKKIVGIVETDEPDDVPPFDAPDEIAERIAGHILRFLRQEMKAGRVPPEFLPLQAGGGSLVNAVVASMGAHDDMPPFHVYGDVFQDSLVDLMESRRLRGASATSLTLSPAKLRHVFDNLDFFGRRLVLRPQEISNNHSVLQRLGVVAINSVLEVDLLGCASATRACHGRPKVAGSCDFVRNAYLSFLITPSASPETNMSAIVPMLSHVDHGEHTVQIVVTEQGLADLRGLDRPARQCAH